MTGPLRADIQVRFADTDALGHLNNASFALYVEHARLEFFRKLGVTVTNLILAHLALDFRRQVDFTDRVYVLTQVERIGNSSIRLKQEVYANDVLAAEAISVIVYFDYGENRSRPIPPELRVRLEGT